MHKALRGSEGKPCDARRAQTVNAAQRRAPVSWASSGALRGVVLHTAGQDRPTESYIARDGVWQASKLALPEEYPVRLWTA